MALPGNTPKILEYLGFQNTVDFDVVKESNGITNLLWYPVDTEPTEQEIIDVGNSQAFLDWKAEHGDDPTLTRRRKAREDNLDGTTPLSVSDRAEMAERNTRDNYLVTRIIELQDAMTAIKASVGQAAAIRDAIPSNFMATDTRDRAAARQSLRDEIDSGSSDN